MSETTRPHQITSRTVAVGDILRMGYGTLTITDHKVAEIVETWYHNGYCNTIVRFETGDTFTIWADDRYENRVYYMQRDGVTA